MCSRSEFSWCLLEEWIRAGRIIRVPAAIALTQINEPPALRTGRSIAHFFTAAEFRN
jgi:hypothetical protein